ncbi:MAG: hypothetical protein AAF799_37710 [Myxococcota bacterium]
MGALKHSVASPDRQSYIYVPRSVDLNVARAIRAMVDQGEGPSRERIRKIVDPMGFRSLRGGARAALMAPTWFGFTEEDKPMFEFIDAQCTAAFERALKRIAFENDEGRNGRRIQGELDKKESDYALNKTSAREAERVRHRERLWKECGISGDLEFSPWIEQIDGSLAHDTEAQEYFAKLGGRTIDNVEVSTAKMRRKRHQAGYTRQQCPLALAIRDIVRWLNGVSAENAKAGFFETVPELFVGVDEIWAEGPFALSWVRELVFYGHGRYGETDEAGFKFDSSMLTTSVFNEPKTQAELAHVSLFMAPGSSILLQGCDTGYGARGKEFMHAFARCIFGKDKWGYIRANRYISEVNENTLIMGYKPGSPVTYKYPDDFR